MIKKTIHRLIVGYLERCAGTFHTGAYGLSGLYVTVMSDQQYHYYNTLVRNMTPAEFHAAIWAVRDNRETEDNDD